MNKIKFIKNKKENKNLKNIIAIEKQKIQAYNNEDKKGYILNKDN